MWSLLPLLAVPVLVMAGFRHTENEHFTLKEFFLLEAVMIVLIGIGFQMARYSAVTDRELWNGRITAKPSGTQGCCHCRTVCNARNKKGQCTSSRRVCDHVLDYWWALDVSTGDRVTIKNCSGWNRTPDAWSQAIIGEPASVEHSYTNYLLADPNSILLKSEATPGVSGLGGTAPAYPFVHDFYHATRILPGQTRASVSKWDAALDEINADLGASKEVNVIVVATTNSSPTYADFIEREWLFGKKNDLIFVLGAPDGNIISWARVVTINEVEILKLSARDEMVGMKLSETEEVAGYMRELIEARFHRTPLAKYEYLWAAATPTPFGMFLLYLLAIGGSVGGSLLMIKEDVFGDEHRGRYRNW